MIEKNKDAHESYWDNTFHIFQEFLLQYLNSCKECNVETPSKQYKQQAKNQKNWNNSSV